MMGSEKKQQISEVKSRIMAFLLQDTPQAVEALCTFLESKAVEELFTEDTELYILQFLAAIAREETRAGVMPTVFSGRTYEQVLTLYRRMVLFLRRLEFGLPEELQRELLSYLEKEEISFQAVLGVIYAEEYFYHKQELVTSFLALLQK